MNPAHQHGERGAPDPPAHLPYEIRRAIAAIVDDLNQPHDPGTIRPTRLEDWATSRLRRIDVD